MWGLRAVKEDEAFVLIHTDKISNRQILTQTINCDSDQCYKEVVKEVMGMLNRKAWSGLEGSRRPSWGND